MLDTHVLVWATSDDRKLGRKTRALIERVGANGQVAVCALTFSELALLEARHRLELPAPAHEWRGQRLATGLIELPIDGSIAVRAVDLSGLSNDPTGRLIVSSALHHRAALVTADEPLLAWEHALVRHDARV